MANKTNSLAHTKWMCKYHIVFSPKYRRKIIYNQYRESLQDIIRTLCRYKGVEILEGHMMPDHVHLVLSIPTKQSVDSFMGYLKGKSALKYYRSYHSGAAKTMKSIQITLAARLEKFNLESLSSLTITDELELNTLGEKKTAIFAIIPDNDTSFNFLVSILYTQLFQQFFEVADKKYGGSLPVHVHFLMDEFANVSLPDDFDKILSVMRSRGVSVSIILQNLAQLKALFEKQWESIVGNCDEFVYLGGNEQATHKYVSELLGKETIDTNTYGLSYGMRGNYTKNDQQTGRELLTPNEVRMLDNRYALLFIRGEHPVKDFKFDIMKHPNVSLTEDGKGYPYIHGDTSGAAFTIELTNQPLPEDDAKAIETGYTLLSEEDVEKLFSDNSEQVQMLH